MAKRTLLSGMGGIALVLASAGGAWGDDFLWTNAGGDRIWTNNANWDRYLGSCGAFVSTGLSKPVAGTGWAIVDSVGNANGCPGVWPDPAVPAGNGPIVDTPTTTNGAFGLVLDNTLTIEPGSYLRASRSLTIGSAAGETGAATVKAGASFYAAWDTAGSGRNCWIADAGTGSLTIDGGWFGTRNVAKVGGANTLGGGPGSVTITNGGTFFGRYISFGSGGNATVQLTDGTIESQEWVVVGGEMGGANLSIATLTMDKGRIRACENSGTFVVGDDGDGTVTQNGGIIEIQDDHGLSPNLQLAVGAGSKGTVNLNGGMLYTKGFPSLNSTGLGFSAVINFAGGKLGTRYWNNADPDNALYQTREFISTGKFANGVSNNPDDASWFYTRVPAPMSKYLHNSAPTDIWLISSPPAACDVYVGPAQTQSLTIRVNDTPVPVQYTVGNYGKTTTATWSVVKNPDVAWLTLDKTGGTVGPRGGTDSVTATVNASGLTPNTTNVVNLEFTHDCDPTAKEVRTISVFVPRWTINPREPAVVAGRPEAADASIVAYLNCRNPQTYTYTIKNLSAAPLSYTVAETDAAGAGQDHIWLQLSKTSGGPLAQNESDTVTVTLTGTGEGTESRGSGDSCVDCVWNGWLKFTAGTDVEMRQIQMTERWLGGLFGYIRTYVGTVRPYDETWVAGAEGSCGRGCTFNLIGAETGQVVQDNLSSDPDYNAQSGYAFKIDQGTAENPGPDPAGRNGYATDVNMGDDAGGDNNALHGRLGTTMLARVKVVRDSETGANLWARDDNTGAGGAGDMQSFGTGFQLLWNSSNQVYEAVNNNGPVTAGMAKPDAYHLIRVIDGWGRYGEHVVKVWVDENQFPEPALEIHGALAEGLNGYDAFCFGTLGINSYSEIYYDWISFTDAGMYAPGEENTCIGTLLPTGACCQRDGCSETQPGECATVGGVFRGFGSRCGDVLCCPDPFADADWDGDVDQADFAALQRCYTGEGFTGTLSPECMCFDRNSEGSDGSIDNRDYLSFEACASGPGIPADLGCD